MQKFIYGLQSGKHINLAPPKKSDKGIAPAGVIAGAITRFLCGRKVYMSRCSHKEKAPYGAFARGFLSVSTFVLTYL